MVRNFWNSGALRRAVIQCGREIRLQRSVRRHIHINNAILAFYCIRRVESERAFLVGCELLAVECTTASGHACTVNQVQRVFVLNLQKRVGSDLCRCATDCSRCRKSHLLCAFRQEIISVVRIRVTSVYEAVGGRVVGPTDRTLYVE